MRTRKINLIELDDGDSITIEHRGHKLEINAVDDVLEVIVPPGHLLSNMVQNPDDERRSEAFFTNPTWWSSGNPIPRGGGLEEIEGPVRFIAFYPGSHLRDES